MRIKYQPKDFRVEERINLPLKRGSYTYYRVEKWATPTTSVRDRLAAKLKLSPSAVKFPALKDAIAVAVQYASARTRKGGDVIKGKGFVAQKVGRGSRALKPRDLEGNQFTLVVRNLAAETAEALGSALEELGKTGLPNYFDEQRFGSLSDKGFIGQAIILRDAELAVCIYLSEPMMGDTKKVLDFKELVRTHWGQWGFLLHQAPRPSNFRSVITFLKDHPHDFRKAVNLIQDRLLSIYLSAYQSWIWNRIVGRYLEQTVGADAWLEIAGTQFPLPKPSAGIADLETLSIALPRLTAYYKGAVGEAAEAVLAEDGVTIQDFKARILKRVYFSKGERLVWFRPVDVSSEAPVADEIFPDRYAVTIAFALDPGCYATLVLKALAAKLGTTLETR